LTSQETRLGKSEGKGKGAGGASIMGQAEIGQSKKAWTEWAREGIKS